MSIMGHFCHEFFGRFGLHSVVFVADFSDVQVCTTPFLSRAFRTFRFARYFCRGFFGRLGLHDVSFSDVSVHDVIFVADFSDVSVFRTFRAAAYLQDCTSTIMDDAVARTMRAGRQPIVSDHRAKGQN